MRLDLVVVNHRTAPDLGAFIDTFVQHKPTGVDWALWVCNVDPQFEDLAIVQALRQREKLPLTHLIWHENIGYARACNAAAAQGEGDVIALFNADVRLTAGALDACYGALKARDDWGILGPRQIDDLGRITSAGVFGTLREPAHRGWRQYTKDYCDIRDDAVTVPGSAYFVKRSVWDELTACPIYQQAAPGADGAFLPTRLFYEETACSYHAHAHGHKVAYFGEVTITHRFHGSIKANRVNKEPLIKEARERFRSFCDLHAIEHD